MNVSARHVANQRTKRTHTTLAVAPVTRAVRAALAVSATVLALSVPGVGLAGTCSYDAGSNTYLCNGGFAQTIAGTLFIPPDDLTLVLGDQTPTSVIPAAGEVGIEAIWGGNVSVIANTGSAIATQGADGLHAYGAGGAASVTNYGSIDTLVTASGANALEVGAVYDVTLINGGAVSASDSSGSYDVIAVNVSSSAGDISIDNLVTGSFDASAYDGDATALSVDGGLIDIGNAGVINADSVHGDATGIAVYGGDVGIDNSGSIEAQGYHNARGIDAFGMYSVLVDNDGTITAIASAADSGRVSAVGVQTASTSSVVNNNSYGDISAAASSTGSGYAGARGIYAIGFGGDSIVYNAGDIQADAYTSNGWGAKAVGVYSFGYGSDSIVDNAGDIQATAQANNGASYATAINSIGYGGDASVTNTGSLSADAFGLYSYALTVVNFATRQSGSAYLDNDGAIHADASGNFATATGTINAAFRYGDAVTVNSGTIDATADGMQGASATGVYNSASIYNGSVDNSGSISATATTTGGDGIALATGISNAGGTYSSYYSNYGGVASVTNSGGISVDANAAGGGRADAIGVANTSSYSSYVTNYGDIDVVASALDGSALAVGAYQTGQVSTRLANYGAISAQADNANGNASAYGAFVYGGFTGAGVVINGGQLNASASAVNGYAVATGTMVMADVATIFNDNSASATATALYGDAVATGARTYGLYSAINNYGDLVANASADGGNATAVGADSYGYFGTSTTNAGSISANASAIGGAASASGIYSLGIIFSAYATNTGTVSADAVGDSAAAMGILNAAVYLGDAITTNSGDITAVAEGGIAPYGEAEATAIGAYNFALFYDSVVDNSGSISATAVAAADISGTYGFLQAKAIGAQAVAAYGYGETTIVNTGDIRASALTSQGYASAWGAVAQSGMYGSVAIENDSLIASYAHTDIGVSMALGAYTLSVAGTSQIVNHGDIVATADAERGIVNVSVNYADATGVRVISVPYGGGAAIVDNYGNIQANTTILGGIGYATGVQAYGQDTSIHNAAGASITATVEAELFGGAFATAVDAGGMYGADLVNDGAITAYGHANAYSDGTNGFYGAAGATGIYLNASFQGDAMVANNGDINAIAIAENSVSWAQGGAGATGVNIYAKYDASIVNTGDINAIADAQFGNVAAYGAVARGKYSSHIVNEAGASIVASASVGSLAGDQYSGRAVSFGTQIFKRGMEDAVTYNAGSIVSHAVVTPDGTETAIGSIASAFGSSIGYNSVVMRGEVVNVGSIEAVASADFGYASAYGAFVATEYDAGITNNGDIQAGASATGGNAFAVGTFAYALHQSVTYNCDAYGCDWANPIVVVDDGHSLIDNSGQITAAATAQGGVGYTYGAVAIGALSAGITNAGQISASTDADDALAIGVLGNSFYGSAGLQNDGDIIAIADGDVANAYGAQILGVYGDVDNGYLAATVTNSGSILARADGTTVTATGVEAIGRNGDGIRIDNAGIIVAAAYGTDATATAAAMDSYGANTLTNTGTIAALGDGARIAISSGAGATASITNSGAIIGAVLTGDLDDSFDNAAGATWNAVGDSDFGAGDDHIVNNGTLVMDNATIRLGGYVNGNTFDNFGLIGVSGSNVLDMDNPFPVYNNGTISFVDGAPDDTLTIVGDFAGDGALSLDVSALNQAGDRLYVDGSVIEPMTQTLNVNLVDVPNAPSIDIPLVSVSGNAATGDFVLGNVSYNPGGFLTLGFDLNSSIDSANAGDDVYSLRVEATGLNGTGSLAAAVAPGAQSLVNAQVGTWHQRMGVVPEKGDTVVAPWMRMFTSSGDMEAQHSSNFGAGGVFGFHQSNHGWELGLDFRPSEHIALGVLLGKSDGSQRLSGGAGSDRFDGSTVGLYGTWLGTNGFYVDLSQRRIDVDARLRAATGAVTTKAKADAFNVETGFTAWTLAGVNVVPQLQYTRTRVDDIKPVQDGGSTFTSDGGVSSRGRLGVAFDKSFQSSGFILTPYGSLNVVREFDGDYDYSVNNGLLGSTRTEGTSAMLELGLGARKGGLSVTGGVDWTDGGAQQGVMGGQLVVRYGW